jgi:hypothetical protein
MARKNCEEQHQVSSGMQGYGQKYMSASSMVSQNGLQEKLQQHHYL